MQQHRWLNSALRTHALNRQTDTSAQTVRRELCEGAAISRTLLRSLHPTATPRSVRWPPHRRRLRQCTPCTRCCGRSLVQASVVRGFQCQTLVW
ncbi:hypothetical protein QQG55_27910 [Brugia pahangi]